MNAIATNNLGKRYDQQMVVDALDLTIHQGELFALLGVNGAGKTTTIKMLTCLIQPTLGDALIYDKSILTHAREIKAMLNVSPQETAVAENLTVIENLRFIAGIYGMSGTRLQNRVQAIIDDFHLAEVQAIKAKQLSGGWKRRLSIAMALITEPQILFLDEPTLGLDVIARRELWQQIQMLKGKITIVLTTHYMEEAEALSDRIGIMVKGKLKAVGTTVELKRLAGKEQFEEAFIEIASK